MSHFNSMAEYVNIVPGVAPVDATTNEKATQWIDMKTAHKVSFIAYFGNIASTSADQVPTITVEAASGAASTSAVTVDFSYREGSVVAANTWGAVTAATSAGFSPATTDDGKLYWIEVDPDAVQADKATARYVRLVMTPDAGASNVLYCAVGFVQSRYSMTTMISTT